MHACVSVCMRDLEIFGEGWVIKRGREDEREREREREKEGEGEGEGERDG